MNVTDFPDSKLIEHLPVVRGSYRQNAELGKNTWFQAGGRAEVLFKPVGADDLATFMAEIQPDIPVFVIGVGSNLLVRDGGVSGVVIRLGRHFTQVEKCEEGIFALPLTPSRKQEGGYRENLSVVPSPGHKGGLGRGHLSSHSIPSNPHEVIIKAGAGLLNAHLTTWCAENGLGGLEFLSGIPGSIGGAIAMNAGAYGSEVKDVLLAAEAVASGELKTFPTAELGFKYRGRDNLRDAVFTAGYFKAYKSPPEEVLARVREIQEKREATQPVRSRTGGSTFKNPLRAKAWELLDQAGCRGLTRGAAQISNLHCNFLINTGGATAAELEDLGNAAIERVLSYSGIQLEWEIRRIGRR